MILSGLVLNKLRKEHNKEKFDEINNVVKTGKTVLIVAAVITVLMIIICICAIVKASKVCGQDTALHVVLILFIPLYALIFCFAGNSICKNSRPRSVGRN